MNTSAPARFARLARLASVAGGLLALAACTVTTTPGSVPDGFTAACDASGLRLAKGFRPAKEVDFVGFRVESTQPRLAQAGDPAPGAAPCQAPCGGDAGGGGDAGVPNVAAWSASFTADVRGTPCSGATDKPACDAKVAALRLLSNVCDGLAVVPKDVAAGAAAPRPPGYCSLTYLVYTRGDEVGTVTGAETLAFLGTIDAPEEAFYLAQLGGEYFSCGSTPEAAYSAVADGYDLVASGGLRAPGCVRRVVHVSKAGAVQLVKQDSC